MKGFSSFCCIAFRLFESFITKQEAPLSTKQFPDVTTIQNGLYSSVYWSSMIFESRVMLFVLICKECVLMVSRTERNER